VIFQVQRYRHLHSRQVIASYCRAKSGSPESYFSLCIAEAPRAGAGNKEIKHAAKTKTKTMHHARDIIAICEFLGLFFFVDFR